MSITTEEQRRQLEAAGWAPHGPCRRMETWRHKEANVTIDVDVFDGELVAFINPFWLDDHIQIAPIVAFYAILQIPIPGYRIIREEGDEGGS